MSKKEPETQCLGVIDLGTNTFHILIAKPDKAGSFDTIFRKRIFVKLGENGLKTIGRQPYQRGLNAIREFRQILDQYQVNQLMAFGTAALRTASNGPDFIQDVKDISAISIQLINGDQEAVYIYRGVIQVIPFDQTPQLIMDIGGGSVEFIIATQDGIQWAQSFPIGLSVLYNNFHDSNPMAAAEILQMSQFLDEELEPLFEELKTHRVEQLIGAAGTFDVVEQSEDIKNIYPSHSAIPTDILNPVFERIITSTLEERLQMSNLPNSRADMIVVAFALMQYIIQKAHIRTLIISPYAMKEGILAEMLEKISDQQFLD